MPLYFQIKSDIESQIQSGHLPPGEKIPSEKKLCFQYQVSRTTVRQAINELVANGKLRKMQGRGTFVSALSTTKRFYKISGFSKDILDQGFIPRAKVLEFKPIIPEFLTSQALGLALDEPAIHLKRLRFVNDEPIGLDDLYLPFQRFGTILEEDFSNQSLYSYLKENMDIVPLRSVNFIEGILINGNLADLLGVKEGFPGLQVIQQVFDQNNLVFQFSQTCFRADRYRFNVEINRNDGDNYRVIKVEKIKE